MTHHVIEKFPKSLRVAAIDFKSLKFSFNETSQLGGVDGRILNVLSEKLGFSVSLKTPADKQWGNKLPDGSWSGLIGMVSRNEADVALGFLSVTNERMEAVDFTLPYTMSGQTFTTEWPGTVPKEYVYLHAFDLITWLSIGAVLFAVPLAIKAVLSTRRSYLGLVMAVFAHILTQSVHIKGQNKVFLIACWLFAGQFISVLYSAGVSSILTVPTMEEPIRTFAELAEAVGRGEYALYTKKGSSSLALINLSPRRDIAYLVSAIKDNEWFTDSMENIDSRLQKRKVAILEQRLEWILVHGRPPLSDKYLSNEDCVLDPISIAVNQGFCCLKHIQLITARIQSSGLFEKFVSDELYKLQAKSAERYKEEEDTDRALSMQDISGALYMLFIGYIVSTIVFCVEILTYKRKGNSAR